MTEDLSAYMIPSGSRNTFPTRSTEKQAFFKSTSEKPVSLTQNELQSLLTSTAKAYISNFSVDSRIPYQLRHGFDLDMELFSQNLSKQITTTYVNSLGKRPIIQRALTAAYRDVESGMRTLSGKLNRYDREFATWLTLKSYQHEGYNRFLFVSEQGPNTCELCGSYHGRVFSLNDVPIPPLHPNCRCELVLMDARIEAIYHTNERAFIESFLQARRGSEGGIYILNHETFPFSITPENLTRISLPNGHIIIDRSNPNPAVSTEFDLSSSTTAYLSQLTSDAKDLITYLINAQAIRGQNKWDSLGSFMDWLTLGIVSGTWRGIVSNYDAMVHNPSLYNIVNFLTLGALDTISGALAPEDPWSLEHWLNIVGTLLTVYAAYTIASGVKQALTGSVDDALRGTGTLVDDTDGLVRSAGLTQKQINDIINIPKGQRPNPSTYLSQEYIDQHLNMFRTGVTKFYAKTPTGTVGPPDGTFVFPSSFADDMITQANGDVRMLEQLLGFDPGDLGNNPTRIDISNPRGLRMPSGNERGANDYWLPGGYTSGGIPEAIVDPAPSSTYTATQFLTEVN